ncbi:MAG TPA: polysaccharide deacetylase family protein [Candidatus Acidoferrales bacterium]|nr:polysaccharide deacetylase family protein [Candidatus Acidoferrales bacterium]
MAKLRLDRLVSLHLVHPARQVFSPQRQRRIPILMYHSIQEGSSDPRPYYNINTSPAQFRQHMKFLRDEGYRAVDLDEGVKSLEQGKHNPKYVVITFDDGYRDFFNEAYPVLAEFGHTAALFVPSGLIQDRRAQFLGRECLTWSEVRELHARGIQIGSHSVTHRKLKYMRAAQLEEEVVHSKNTIEAKIGQSVKSFSYPYAFPETEVVLARTLRELLEKHGYENGVTTILGTVTRASDRFFLPRLPVNSSDDLTLFRAKLEGSYDWLHAAQYLTKAIKSIYRGRAIQTPAPESGRL